MWDEGVYDPHGEIVKQGKKNMILTGLKVAKKVAFESGLSAHGSDSEPESDTNMDKEPIQDDRLFGPE